MCIESHIYVVKPKGQLAVLVVGYGHSGGGMKKLIGYSRVSTRQQSTDRQVADILAAGVRADDLYIDHGVSGSRASRPEFDRAVAALLPGDTLVITTLDRLGRSTQNMLAFAEELRARNAGLRVLNLGGGDVDTATPMGSMVFTIMAALGQMEYDIKRERVVDSINKRRAAGESLGGRPRTVKDSQVRNANRLVESGAPIAQAVRDLGMSRATFYRRSRELEEIALGKKPKPRLRPKPKEKPIIVDDLLGISTAVIEDR